MHIQFWGTRGSIAISGQEFQKYGGNTTCLEIVHGNERLIFDAGTGVRSLGEKMTRENDELNTSLFFTHLHWDHIQGFPFFAPAYRAGRSLHIYGAGRDGAQNAELALRKQMHGPSFPVPMEAMKAELKFDSIEPEQEIVIGPFTIIAFWVDHPQGCAGYRVEADNQCVVFITDAELQPLKLSRSIRKHARLANVLVLDAQYTPEEYNGTVGPVKKGWGHTHHLNAAQIANTLSARSLVLFHHDPQHDDNFIDDMVGQAQQVFPMTTAAREGVRTAIAPFAAFPWGSNEISLIKNDENFQPSTWNPSDAD